MRIGGASLYPALQNIINKQKTDKQPSYIFFFQFLLLIHFHKLIKSFLDR